MTLYFLENIELVILLLLLTSLVTTVFRNIIGIKTLNIYIVLIYAVIFVSNAYYIFFVNTEFDYWIILFSLLHIFLIFILHYITLIFYKKIVSGLNIHYYAKVSLATTSFLLLVYGISMIFNLTDLYTNRSKLALVLTILLLSFTLEPLSSLLMQKGLKTFNEIYKNTLFGCLIISIIIILFITYLHNMLNIWLFFIFALLIIIYLGKFAGLRLTEIYRFREIIKKND